MLDIHTLKSLYNDFGGEWGEINPFGIHFSENYNDDLFHDILGIASDTKIIMGLGTTHPSLQATIKPITINGITGAAHVFPGFHRQIWQVGIHAPMTKYNHIAFVQTGNKIKIWRDIHQNFKYTRDCPILYGWWGISFHRAAINNQRTIKQQSAGCQCIQGHEDFNKMMNLIVNSESYKKDNKFRFNYMLFDFTRQFPLELII